MSWCGSPVILLISKNLFAILLRTRDTESGGARYAHIFHICSASCAPSFPVRRALVTDRKQVLRHNRAARAADEFDALRCAKSQRRDRQYAPFRRGVARAQGDA